MNAEPSSILIVDDEELNSEGLARRLAGHGYTAIAAKSGRKAIELLGPPPFDFAAHGVMETA